MQSLQPAGRFDAGRSKKMNITLSHPLQFKQARMHRLLAERLLFYLLDVIHPRRAKNAKLHHIGETMTCGGARVSSCIPSIRLLFCFTCFSLARRRPPFHLLFCEPSFVSSRRLTRYTFLSPLRRSCNRADQAEGIVSLGD